MTDKEKISLAERMIELVEFLTPEEEQPKRMIGVLNKPWGLNGFKRAEPGTPVFEFKDKYIIMVESLNGKTGFEVTFYKDTLKSAIDFDKAL